MRIIDTLAQSDQRLFLKLNLWLNQRSYKSFLVALFRAISRTGDGYVQVLLPLLLWLWFGSHANVYLQSMLLAFTLERSVYWLLKNGLKRRRPPAIIPFFQSTIIASDEFSFPSGHTSAAFLLAILTVSFIPALAMLLFPWAMAVGLSRVVLGVHFPADILAGMSLALGIAYAVGSVFA